MPRLAERVPLLLVCLLPACSSVPTSVERGITGASAAVDAAAERAARDIGELAFNMDPPPPSRIRFAWARLWW